MAQSKAYTDLLALIDSEFFNPGHRFVTPADYTAQIQKAIVQYAQDVKGLWLQVDVTSVAGQFIYPFDEAHQRIRQAFHIRNADAANEERVPLDIITDADRAYIDQISQPLVATDNLSITVSGQQSDKPKYVIHQREMARIIVQDIPAVSGDIIRLKTISEPTVAFTVGTSWQGDAGDLPAIASKVCAGLRRKSRDTAEAAVFEAEYDKAVERVRGFRAKTRQVKQLGDGQSRVTRVNPMFGAK